MNIILIYQLTPIKFKTSLLHYLKSKQFYSSRLKLIIIFALCLKQPIYNNVN